MEGAGAAEEVHLTDDEDTAIVETAIEPVVS